MGPKKDKKKRSKDPLRPKRPLSAYFYFAKDCRDKLKSEGKSISRVADFTKEVSSKWRTLAKEDKKTFEKSAETDKKRFDAEMVVYKGTKGPKKKRAATAYFHFLSEFRKRPDVGAKHIKEISKDAGAAWRALSKEEKLPFVAKYEAQRKEIAEEEAKKQLEGSGAGAAAEAECDMEEEEDYEDEDEEEDDD